MKTFVHIDKNKNVVGIGLIYLESGGFTEGITELIKRLGEDEGILEAGRRTSPLGIDTVIVDTLDMPNNNGYTYDKYFAGAWVYGNDKKINIDLPKAKEIKKEKLKKESEPFFEQLDVQFMRALEKNEDTTAIVTEKRRLRDITNLVDKCKTLKELEEITCKESIA